MGQSASAATLTAERFHLLAELQALDEIDEKIAESVSEVGASNVLWYIWRFKRFSMLEPLRHRLLNDYRGGKLTSIPLLESLLYLQENISETAGSDMTSPLSSEIFGEICRIAARHGPSACISRDLIWTGKLDRNNSFGLPTLADFDVGSVRLSVTESHQFLLDAARLNRLDSDPYAIVSTSPMQFSRNYNKERAVEFHIGPYFFRSPEIGERAASKIHPGFISPFLRVFPHAIEFLVSHERPVVPVLCWRGGLAPEISDRASLVCSYHSRSDQATKLHYKFGHFSDVMHFDPLGYAGFSQYAMLGLEHRLNEVADFSDEQVASDIRHYVARYVEGKFTWRVQDVGPTRIGRGRRTFFFPLQDPLDEVSRLSFVSRAEIIRCFQAALRPDDVLIIKRHPVDRTSSTTLMLASLADDSRICVSNAPIHDILKVADLVVTVNSGVGFEALLAGVPVVMCGLSDYNPATHTVRSAPELLEALSGRVTVPPPDVRMRVIWHYFYRYVIDSKISDLHPAIVRSLNPLVS